MSLTRRQRVFVEAYLRTFNASAAAREAGYSERSARELGRRLLTVVDVKAEIDRRLAELTMSTDEVLTRLTEQARAAYAPYLRADGTVNLVELLAEGKGHLIKGFKWTAKGDLLVEFYDAQAALGLIGKHRQLFTDKVDLTSGGQALSNVVIYLPDNGRDGDTTATGTTDTVPEDAG